MIRTALVLLTIISAVSAQAQSRICANKTTGNILIRSTCYSTETTISNIASLKGPKGDKGDTGLQGLRGLTGAQGIQGEQGLTGPKGEKGETGAQGPVVDVTKCRKAEVVQTVYHDSLLGGWLRGYSLMCNQDEFLLNQGLLNNYYWEGDPQPGYEPGLILDDTSKGDPYWRIKEEGYVYLIKTRQQVTDGQLKAAFVISRVIKNTKLSKEVNEALSSYSLPVLNSLTTQRVVYATSAAEGQTVMTQGNLEAKEEVQALTNEILDVLHGRIIQKVENA